MPQLKAKLKEEFERDRIDMENEHERRLKELHEIHQSEQVSLQYDVFFNFWSVWVVRKKCGALRKNSTAGEANKKYESINWPTPSPYGSSKVLLLSFQLLEHCSFSEKTIKLRALTQWRQATREKIEEKKLSKLSSMMYKRLLMRRYFNQWASAVKSKWKSKVEKGNFYNI